MKKITLSLVLCAVLGGSLMASDTNSLTKAVVQLIKDNHSINSHVNALSDHADTDSKNIELNLANLEAHKKATADTLDSHDKRISENKADITSSKAQIENLFEKIGKTESVANSASDTANQTKALVEEMRGISSDFKTQSGEMIGSAKTAYEKSSIVEEKTKSLEISVSDYTSRTKVAEEKIKVLESEVARLSLGLQKQDEISSKLDSTKIYLEAEIKILKAKFDRARPVYVMDNEKSSLDCTNGKCTETNDADAVIKNFIK
jgi:chromosome segregation ATPase